jgi:predicted PurR-regulated permease PerM
MVQTTLSPSTKRTIFIALVLGALIVLYNVSSILPPFALAAVLAYILNPLVDALVRLTKRSRSSVVALLYAVLLVALILSIVLIVPALIHQVQAANLDMEDIGARMRQLVETNQHIVIAGFALDLLALVGEVSGAIQSVASFLAARTGQVFVSVLSGLFGIILILLISFYLLKDAANLHRFMYESLPPGYQADLQRVSMQINRILSDYLRGQLLLAIIVGIVTGFALAIAGVRNALLLGVLAGVLEVVPSIGPVLASVPAIAIALVQGSTHFAIANQWFALLITGVYVVIQQLENNVLAPRIIGHSVNLHPVVVIFAVLAGATLAGLLGIFLAVPITAIGRVLVSYVFQKLRE